MPTKHSLHKVALAHPGSLQTLVENRRIFNLKHCELNIFESYQQAYQVPLTFNDFVITSMIRGRKVMHLFDDPAFDYLPGESVILPANETMRIDFPEATPQNPTQCIALTVDASYVEETIRYLNDYYNDHRSGDSAWQLHFTRYHFSNDTEISDLINKIIRVCSSADKSKNIFADLSLKELLIRLIQTQRLQQTALESSHDSNQTRFHAVLHYIHEHLSEKIAIDALCRKAYLSRNVFFKWFREQSGISPLEYINAERVKLAKHLLADARHDIRSVSIQCGFNDVNYFTRVFKKIEGITPGAYLSSIAR
ncbi:AraC family transcriptional regulator [Chitinophaga japonensis]|uniref:AraC-like DNA-binding protein n=1 Tax=Chitinophaga japonensis TaxID=104662 RepID=A0A562SMJ9_CHIJA|nr:AraC family transcriptional regulator [Chitinophaga japonensis]TWI82525.1 AraC-like DNA-binding protein [Chitinophaga japonensis]